MLRYVGFLFLCTCFSNGMEKITMTSDVDEYSADVKCSICGEPYRPASAQINHCWGPHPGGLGTAQIAESVTYRGECRNGHLTCDTVPLTRPAVSEPVILSGPSAFAVRSATELESPMLNLCGSPEATQTSLKVARPLVAVCGNGPVRASVP